MTRSLRIAVLVLGTVPCGFRPAAAAPSIQLQSSASGVLLGGTMKSATMNMGNGNGLGVGAQASGVALLQLADGPSYSSPVSLFLTGWGGSASVTVTASVTTNFAHGGGSAPAIAVVHCVSASCTMQSEFQELPASPSTQIRAGLADKTTFGYTIGVLIAYVNGTAAFTGSDTATVTFSATDLNNTGHKATATLAISATVQQAVQLAIDGTGAVPVTAGVSTDYQANFGAVDGLGVSAAGGAPRVASPTGALYSMPYVVRPGFSSMTTSTGTVRMYVSSNFAHPSLLQLQHSATGSSDSFAPISTSSSPSQQTVLSANALSRIDLARYLGLFVFNLNGAGAFDGADSAVVTYTLVIQ